MKWLLLGLPAGVYWLFAAEAVAPDGYAGWIEGGATLVVSGLLVLLVSKIIPAMYRDHQIALKEQQEAFTSTLDKMGERHDRWETQRHEDSQQVAEALKLLSANCAEERHARRNANL